jgi:hypothetical protein
MMADQSNQDTGRPARPSPGGSMFSRKFGPLPGWAWAGLLGVGAVGILWLRSRSAKAATTTVDTSGNDMSGVDYSGELSTIQAEIGQLQGAAGTTGTTGAAGGGTGATAPTGTTPGSTKPTGGTVPGNKPVTPAPKTRYVTVVVKPYTDKNPPWQSTLSGIAAHYHVAGGYQALAKLNGIQNPNLIHTGDRIKVPVT